VRILGDSAIFDSRQNRILVVFDEATTQLNHVKLQRGCKISRKRKSAIVVTHFDAVTNHSALFIAILQTWEAITGLP
jgi:hypothetical protein